MMPRRTTRRATRQRGSVLLLVLLAVVLISALAAGFNNSQATGTGIAANVDRHLRARIIAESGLETAVNQLDRDPDWRSNLLSGVWVNAQSFAGGAFDITGTDADGDLANNDADPLQVAAVGRFDGATFQVSATVRPIKRLLMVVGNAAAPAVADRARRQVIQSWGWRVQLIDDDATSSEWTAAAAQSDAIYASASANASSIGSTINSTTLGVVSETSSLALDLGLLSILPLSFTSSQINIPRTDHFITQTLGSGNRVIAGGMLNLNGFAGTLAPGVSTLATSPLLPTPTLIVIDAGGDSFGDQFVIEDGRITPQNSFAARVTVLGAAIQSGNWHMPVTTRVRIQTTNYDPFGSFDLGITGNVNDGANPRHYVLADIYPGGTPITVLGRSWQKKRSNYSGTQDSQLQPYLTVDSGSVSQQVKILRNGDPVPDIEGMDEQADVQAFIADYIDFAAHKIVLDANQAICLFELGTTNMHSSAADFQDLVVLITLAKSTSSFGGGNEGQGGAGTAAGRRVFLPWSQDVFDSVNLSSDGLTLLRRSLEWAAQGRSGGLSVQLTDQP